MQAAMDVTYQVESDDTIGAVNDAWSAFAVENHAPELVSSGVVGRRLWDFIAGGTTRSLYRALFEQVRSGSTPVRFAFRCDSPEFRRLLQMEITSAGDGALVIAVRTLKIDARPAVALLDVDTARSDKLINVCSWCKRIEDYTGAWLDIEAALQRMGLMEQAVLPAITHGICERCLASVSAMIRNRDPASSGDVEGGPLT